MPSTAATPSRASEATPRSRVFPLRIVHERVAEHVQEAHLRVLDPAVVRVVDDQHLVGDLRHPSALRATIVSARMHRGALAPLWSLLCWLLPVLGPIAALVATHEQIQLERHHVAQHGDRLRTN